MKWSAAHTYNTCLLILLSLVWISTWVAFGGTLHKASVMEIGMRDPQIWRFRWREALSPLGEITYDDWGQNYGRSSSLAHHCKHGGRGMLAMMLLCFFGVMLHLTMVLTRATGKRVHRIIDSAWSCSIEMILCGLDTFWLFLAVVIWGGTCYKQTQSSDFTEVVPSGYLFMIFAMFFNLTAAVLTWKVRSTEALHCWSAPQQYQFSPVATNNNKNEDDDDESMDDDDDDDDDDESVNSDDADHSNVR
jgi:hypothetical protein